MGIVVGACREGADLWYFVVLMLMFILRFDGCGSGTLGYEGNEKDIAKEMGSRFLGGLSTSVSCGMKRGASSVLSTPR